MADKITNQTAIDAAKAAEALRPQQLAAAQAQLAAAQTKLGTLGSLDVSKNQVANATATRTLGSQIAAKAAAKGLVTPDIANQLAQAATQNTNAFNAATQNVTDIGTTQAQLDAAKNLTAQYGTPYSIPAAQYEKDTSASNSAYALLLSEFQQYGLGSLVEPLKNLVEQGLSPAEFSLALQNTDAYKQRFSANQDRISKGLRALSPAEYIGLEDQYQNIMRNYGLPASYYAKDSMGTQSGFNQLLGNDVSAAELEDRVMTAQSRVVNANPETMQALKQFYPGITNGDILSYALDPTKALTDIKRKVTASEIGGAALGQGLSTSQTAAEGLAAAGVTKAQAQQGYSSIAEFLPTGQKLSQIYQESPYTQQQAEQEIFNLADSAAAAKKRKRLSQLETGTFSGSSGVGALNRDRQVSNYMMGQPGAGSY